ncbi:MAG: hypothetical protein OEY52_02905 [Gammaproteobacteria bacterium]|nr:hypothetical protein [Gammaproteobacteria bacterium]
MKLRTLLFITCLGVFQAGCGGADSTTNTSTGEGKFITVKMTFANLPESLPINHKDNQNQLREYYWHAIFDMDGSNTESAGDFRFELGHVKREGDSRTEEKLSNFEVAFLVYEEPFKLIQHNIATLSIIDNSIVIKVDKSKYSGLNKINKDINVNFSTFSYDAEHKAKFDYYPALDSYETIGEGKFIDDVDSSDLSAVPHIDLVEMEITID